MRSRAGRLGEARRRLRRPGRRPAGLVIVILALSLAIGGPFLARSPAAPEGPAAAADVVPEAQAPAPAPAAAEQAAPAPGAEPSSETGPAGDAAPAEEPAVAPAPRFAAPGSDAAPPPQFAQPSPSAPESPGPDSVDAPPAESEPPPAEPADVAPAEPADVALVEPADETPSEPAPPPALAAGQPLGNLAPDVVERLSESSGDVAVAAIDLRRNLAFTHQGDVHFDLASVAKVPLMLAVLREGERGERPLTLRERSLLEVMIHTSDNDAASVLWAGVAGGEPAPLLDGDVWPGVLVSGDWGLWTGTAPGVARIFREIVAGESLSPDVRGDAMRLLDGVVHWQRWGVSAGLPGDGASVALKNGWYPQEEAGWIVHSAGYVLDAGGRPDYVLVVLSRNNRTLEGGIALVEEIAAGLHAALRPAVVSAGPRPPMR